MTNIKSVVLNKTETKSGYLVEFFNPIWGRFVIDCKYDKEDPAFNNTINLLRVGDYFLIKGKAIDTKSEISEYSIVKYMAKETEAVRMSGRKLAIPNMNAQQMYDMADNLLNKIKTISNQNSK